MSGIYPYFIDPNLEPELDPKLVEEYDRIKTEVELDPDYSPLFGEDKNKEKIRL